MGDCKKALEYFLELLKVKEKIGNKRHIATALSNIGDTHEKMGNYHQAKRDYKRALQYYKLYSEVMDTIQGVSMKIRNYKPIDLDVCRSLWVEMVQRHLLNFSFLSIDILPDFL